ncbi:MAG: ferritin family protein [Candidatus ainarchaeum sp.]|nr:ferritin family protein [Candidatus ainarchaeum sp.]
MFEEFFGSESVDVGKGLAIAADLERRSIRYYEANAARAGQGYGRRLFEFLAREEKKHLAAVQALAAQAGKGAARWAEARASAQPGVFKGFLETRAGAEVAMPDSVTAAAQAAETESMEFYERLAAREQDREAKKFFKAMAAFEKTHFELLAGLYELGRARVESAGYPGDFI